MKKRVCVLTTGRQDWGILRSTARLLADDPEIELQLLVGGMHCSERFGATHKMVEADGFEPAALVPWVDEALDSSHAQAGLALRRVGEILERMGPECLVLVGDRFETAAAAMAATLTRIPIVHLHGGEETEGAFDNQLRHAITKLSHLHLVSHEAHAARVRALGENPRDIHVVGAPGLDNIHRDDLADRAELEAFVGMSLHASSKIVLVTLHPSTLGAHAEQEAEALAHAMDAVDATYVITLPNADPGHESTRARLLAAVQGNPRRRAVSALGERRYFGLLRIADAVLGNSSSAIIEAPVLGLPAVNIGDRQKGRMRGGNLLDTVAEPQAIAEALRKALSPEFRARAKAAPSPFGDGHSGGRIHRIISAWTPPDPPTKIFFAGASP